MKISYQQKVILSHLYYKEFDIKRLKKYYSSTNLYRAILDLQKKDLVYREKDKLFLTDKGIKYVEERLRHTFY